MKKGGMTGGPADQAKRGANRAFESDVRIPPHETEGSWSIGEMERSRGAAKKTAAKKTAAKKTAAKKTTAKRTAQKKRKD